MSAPMELQFCPPPTLAETKALASFSSLAPLKYDRMHEVLGEILSFCQRPDVNGFFFTREPIQVPHFLKPNVLDGAFTGEMLATLVESGTELDKTQATDHSTGSFVLYHAFVSQNLSFGFAVNNIVHSPANRWGAGRGISYNSELRYVRDNDKRVLLSLADAEDVGMMQFHYTQLISTTCQLRTVACFARKEFMAITSKNHYDVTDFLRAMFHMQTGVELRTCPLCMKSHGKCSCELPDYRPKHPFDREMFLRNIQMHLGSFEGPANVALLKDGKGWESSSVGCRVTLQGRIDRELAERLRRWVVKKYYGSQSPWQSRLFTSDQGNENGNEGKMEIGVDELSKAFGSCSQTAGSFPSPRDSYGYLSELLECMESENWEASDTASGLTNQAVLIPELQEASVESSAEVVRRDSVDRLKKDKVLLGRNARQTVNGDADLEEIQKMKEERRKEQNRMSARRSNQRKKAFNDALKRSLKEMHERAASLRARELQLRRENLELRKRLEDQ